MGHIYLLRHGETDWNREERLQGSFDVPLNKTGIKQACVLARRLEKLPVGQVFTSNLLRARETAAIISSKKKWPLFVRDDLREIDHGIWAGMKLKAIERLYPGQLAIWRLEPDRLNLERGERLQDAYYRAARFLSGLLKSALEGDVLVVGHGVTNSLILCAAAGTAIGRMEEFFQPNASIAVLRTERRTIVSIEGLKDESID